VRRADGAPHSVLPVRTHPRSATPGRYRGPHGG